MTGHIVVAYCCTKIFYLFVICYASGNKFWLYFISLNFLLDEERDFLTVNILAP